MAILDTSSIESELIKIVGKEHISSDTADCVAYERDDQFWLVPAHRPDFVVKPQNKEEIQAIIRLANENKIPIIPYGAGVNRKGLCIAQKGGIILDLRRMDRIEIDEEMMIAKVEPGVNFAQMVVALNKYPKLRCLTPDAPATASVLANYMLRGIYPTATRYGIDHLITMEIVLPNGSILNTGSAATPNSLGPYCGIVNGPDLTKLLQANVGTMGVVTEGRIRLYPMPEKIEPMMIRYPNFESMVAPAIKYTIQNMVSGIWLMTFDQEALKIFMQMKQAEEEMFASLIFIEGTESQVESQKEKILKIAETAGGENFELPKFMREEFLQDHRYMRTFVRGWRKGNLYGCSAYGSMQKLVDYYEISKKMCRKYDFNTLHFEALPVGLHGNFHGQLVYIDPCVLCDLADEEEFKRVQNLAREIRQSFLDIGIYGFFRAFPGIVNSQELGTYGEIWRKIKNLIDPNNIMNPGKPPLE
ncbi:MAG: FAD-binding oxidoreductase [Candidatus Helarchaeota archaeon]